MPKNKIIWCADSPGWGGSEKDLIRILGYLHDNTRNSLLLNKYCSNEFLTFVKDNNYNYRLISCGNSLKEILLSFYVFCKKFLFRKDVIFIFWCHHLDTFRWQQLFCSLFGKKFGIVERLIPSDNSFLKQSKLTRPLKRIANNNAMWVVLCSFSQQENYQNWFSPKRLLVIPNSRKITDIRLRVAHYKKVFEPPFEVKETCICSIARLEDQKDPLTILDAVYQLKDKQDITLILVGDGTLMQLLQERIELYNLSNVYLIGHDYEPLKWLAYANIFILNSLSEGLPGVLIEAMAAGVACIATDIPGNRELVIHEQTGLLIPIKNAKALAFAIERLIKNRELKDQCSTNAYQHVIENYDDSAEEKKWLDLLEKRI